MWIKNNIIYRMFNVYEKAQIPLAHSHQTFLKSWGVFWDGCEGYMRCEREGSVATELQAIVALGNRSLCQYYIMYTLLIYYII